MKDYIVMNKSFCCGRRYLQFDTEADAIKAADKRQKTRKGDVVVLKKIEKRTCETVYAECYNARKNDLSPVRYSFVR